jgi:hypothetical protein
MTGKPTPTQAENDAAALGQNTLEHEDDGSGPDPYAVKTSEAKKPAATGSYQTRQSTPVRSTSHTTS